MGKTDCQRCTHKGRDVVDGLCWFCARMPPHPSDHALTLMLSQLGHAILEAQGVRAPSPKKAAANEAAADAPPTPAPPKTRQIYVVDVEKTYGTPSATYETLVGGALDRALNAEDFDRLMHCLAQLRGSGFKHAVSSYTVGDCSAVRALLTTWKPSDIARMIRAACRDPFYASQVKTIEFSTLATKGAALLAAPVIARKQDQRAELVGELGRLLESWAVSKRAVIDLAEVRAVDTSMMTLEQLASHIETVKTQMRNKSIRWEAT